MTDAKGIQHGEMGFGLDKSGIREGGVILNRIGFFGKMKVKNI